MKIYLLEHVAEDSCWFETLALLDASQFEHDNEHIEKSYYRVSRCMKTRITETMAVSCYAERMMRWVAHLGMQ